MLGGVADVKDVLARSLARAPRAPAGMYLRPVSFLSAAADGSGRMEFARRLWRGKRRGVADCVGAERNLGGGARAERPQKGVIRPVILVAGRRIRPPPKRHGPRGWGAAGFNSFLEKPVFRRVRNRVRFFECVFAAVFDGAMALARRLRRFGLCRPNVWLGLRPYCAVFSRG